MLIFIKLKYEKLRDWFYLNFRNPYGLKPYGYAPVQAEGTLSNGEWYYFRARGKGWSLYIAETQAHYMHGNLKHVYRENYGDGEFDASCMPKDDVIKLATKAINNYLRK